MGSDVMCSYFSYNINKLVQWSQGNCRDM